MTPPLEFDVVFQMLIESNPEKETSAQYMSSLQVSFTSGVCVLIFKNNLHAILLVIMQDILHFFTSFPHNSIENLIKTSDRDMHKSGAHAYNHFYQGG